MLIYRIKTAIDMPARSSGSSKRRGKAASARRMAMKLDSIPGIGDSAIARLHSQGIRTLADLARSDSSHASQAQCLLSGKPLFLDKHVLQEGCAYLDIESRTFHRDVFLIGIIYTAGGRKKTPQYVSIYADTESKLAKMYNKFLKEHLSECHTIYHWGSYDATNMRRINCMHTERLSNMLKYFKRSCLLPISSYSIKYVADYCGFDGYDQTDVSAVECGYLWDQYVHSGNKKSLERILKYNRIDCEAMAAVYEWYCRTKD